MTRLTDDELRALVGRGKIKPDQSINQGTLEAAAKAPSLAAEVLELRAEVARWKQNSVDTWSAMTAMRNAINEHVPMPSLESDLLKGPENSIFCATVAEAVVAALTAERGNADRLAGVMMGLQGLFPDQFLDVQQALAAHMKLRGK